jgi:hypothetical protein
MSSWREREWREEERTMDQWLWARDWWVTVARRAASRDWWLPSSLVARGVVSMSFWSRPRRAESGVVARQRQLHLSQQSQ